ncbi:MAG: hypothetical protein R3D85_03790 [Paracoccaceae bacterium]
MAAVTTCWARPRWPDATAAWRPLAAQGIEGRVRYYGCPAEEGGAAKTFMVRPACSTMSTRRFPGTRGIIPA